MYRSRTQVLVGGLFSLAFLIVFYIWLQIECTSLQQSVMTTATSTPVESKLTIAGDVMLARHVETLLKTHGSDYVWSGLSKPLSTDPVLVNFESAMVDPHVQTPDFTFQFATSERYLGAMREFGVTHASLMNNHSFDFGLEGFQLTKRRLLAHGIQPIADAERAYATSSMQLANHRAGVAAVDFISGTPDKAELITAVKELVSKNDIVIIYPHWGTEYETIPNTSQQTWARVFIDAGANAVIGHHPHVVQTVGWYRGVPIFYSLGNMVFDQYFDDAVQTGMFLGLLISEETIQYKLQPYSSVGQYSQPRTMSSSDRDLFLQSLATESASLVQSAIRQGVVKQSW